MHFAFRYMDYLYIDNEDSKNCRYYIRGNACAFRYVSTPGKQTVAPGTTRANENDWKFQNILKTVRTRTKR